jgi:hypothetical protein
MLVFRLVLVVAIFAAANVLTLAAPNSVAAVRVGGEAYGLAVGSPAVGAPGAAYVQLPPEGGSVAETSPGSGYGSGNAVGSLSQIETRSAGDLGAGTVTSTTTVMDGELLGGVVRGHDIRVSATAGGSRPAGSFVAASMLVAGIEYRDARPNTRVDVPGVGIVILNEQLVGGDGGGTSAIIVRAARLQITEPSLFGLPRGTDLILAHAAAGVPDVVATRPVSSGPAPKATDVPWDPISAYRPVDVSLGNGNDEDDDNFSFDNGNDNNINDNGGGGGGGGGTPGTGTPGSGIVITVIVIQATPTNTPVPGAATATPVPGAATATPTPRP